MISLAIGAFRTTLNKLELSVSEWKQDRIRVFSEINETRIYDNDIDSNDDNYNTGNDVSMIMKIVVMITIMRVMMRGMMLIMIEIMIITAIMIVMKKCNA